MEIPFLSKFLRDRNNTAASAQSAAPLNPNARDLRTDPAVYIRPEEVREVIIDGKKIDKVISAQSVGEAFKKAEGTAEAAKKSGYTARIFKNIGKAALAVVAVVAALKAASWISKRGKPEETPQEPYMDMVAAQPQAMFLETPANEVPGNHWQNTVKAGRGQASQSQALNPKMNILPAEMVQDLGAPAIRGK